MNLLETIPGRIFDESAYTLWEIVEARGLTIKMAYRLRDEKMSSGEWEEVYKRVKGKPVKAYRLSVTKRNSK